MITDSVASAWSLHVLHHARQAGKNRGHVAKDRMRKCECAPSVVNDRCLVVMRIMRHRTSLAVSYILMGLIRRHTSQTQCVLHHYAYKMSSHASNVFVFYIIMRIIRHHTSQ